MRLLFAGTPEAAVPALEALLASRHDVAAVLTRPDAPVGRGKVRTASPVAQAAQRAGVEVWKPRSVRGDDVADRLRDLAVDAVAVVAFGALLPQTLLDIPRHGWINLHFSLLPAWRGAAPVQAAIRAGDEITGASTFRIEKDLDTGPVFGTVTEAVRPTDTAGELLGRLSAAGADLLVATMDGVADGALDPQPQPVDGISYAGKITSADARVDFDQPAFAVDRLIRSVTPAPGAWTPSRWGRLTLGPVRPVAPGGSSDEGSGQGPDAATLTTPGVGEITVGRREVTVGTATGPVVLSTVQAPGKRAMPAVDWARGARPEPGERLGERPSERPSEPPSERPGVADGGQTS